MSILPIFFKLSILWFQKKKLSILFLIFLIYKQKWGKRVMHEHERINFYINKYKLRAKEGFWKYDINHLRKHISKLSSFR